MADREPTDRPFVSAIVPVYNDPVRLERCVQALIDQTYPPDRYEIVVVDNGSREPVADRLSGYPRVRVVREERPGSYAARNRGVAAAAGSVLAFTDSDCIPGGDWIERGVAALIGPPGRGLVAGRIDVFPGDPAAPTSVELYEQALAFRQERNVQAGHFGVTANLFTTRSVMDRVGRFEEGLVSGGDRVWGNAVFDADYEVAYGEHVVVAHPARASFRELRTKMRRIAYGHASLHPRRDPAARVVLVARLIAPPVENLVEIWRSDRIGTIGQKLRASVVAVYAKYVWSLYRAYFALGGGFRRSSSG